MSYLALMTVSIVKFIIHYTILMVSSYQWIRAEIFSYFYVRIQN